MRGGGAVRDRGEPAGPRRRGAAVTTVPGLRVPLACAAVLALAAVAELRALPATALSADLGIQAHLAQQVLDGAVPVRDFEHGWNVLSWWAMAALWAVSGGNASLWAFLWSVALGQLLVGLLGLHVARRHGLQTPWLVALTAATVASAGVPNGKYALPLLWLALLRPGGRGDRPVTALVLRALLAGLLLLAHVELAVMLCAGTALHDLLGVRGYDLRVRCARVLALLAGATAAAGIELAAYAAAGVGPQRLVTFLVLDRARISDAATAYDWSLLDPPGLLGALHPASLLLAFVPALWLRLADTTRLAAALHLSLGLVALQTVDVGHVRAASALLVLLVVLGAWDVGHAPAAVHGPVRAPLLVLVGAAWSAGSVLAAVRVGSVLVLPLLLLAACAGPALARGRWSPAFSAGALAGALAVAATGTVGVAAAGVRGPDDARWERSLAAAVGADVDRCVGADRRAWVVPEPLGLYRLLALQNPTPYHLFWPGFADEHPALLRRMAAGQVPAIVQVGPWPGSVLGVAPQVEAQYALCAEVTVPEQLEHRIPERTVRVWVRHGAGPA